MADGSDMLTTTQAGKLLGVDRATVARWVRLGQLAAVRLPSGQIRIPRHAVERLLRQAQEG
jgi:excisionase family DNA binding protein